MIIEKLLSKRGQISMELGILVAAAVAVAAIAAYYYVTSVRTSAGGAMNESNNTITRLRDLARDAANRINTTLD